MSDFQSPAATLATISSHAVIGDLVMSDHRGSPTVRRRQLGTFLRQLREEKGLTPAQVAKEFDWSIGKVRYLEGGKSARPDLRDVTDLLKTYEADDERQIDFATKLVREARRRGWWHAYKDQLSETYSTYVGLEAGATAVFNWEIGMIPGQLQTRAYAERIIEADAAKADRKTIGDRVEVRMKRQSLLTQDDPLQLWAVMDEAALRRKVGGEDVMREQMAHLVEVAQLPHVHIQVIRFDSGAHAGGRGPFAILRFAEPEDTPAVYVDNAAGELFIEDVVEVQRFIDASQRLLAVADSPDATLRLIAKMAA